MGFVKVGRPNGHMSVRTVTITDVEISRFPSLSYVAFFNLGAARSKASEQAANEMRTGLRTELSVLVLKSLIASRPNGNESRPNGLRTRCERACERSSRF
jgi:hypothetical protein